MLLILARQGMSVLDWTINTFNCQVSAINRYHVRVWQSFNLFRALEGFLNRQNWNIFSLEGAEVARLDDYSARTAL
ncbi:unnamed protein product [Prunus armeniaca]